MQQQESARGGGEETTTNQRRHTSRKSDIPPAMQRDKMGDPETASLPGPRPNQPIPSLKKLQITACALLNRLQVLGPKKGSGWPRHECGTATISGSRTRSTPIGLSCLFFLSMESDTGTRTNRNCKVVRVLPPLSRAWVVAKWEWATTTTSSSKQTILKPLCLFQPVRGPSISWDRGDPDCPKVFV